MNSTTMSAKAALPTSQHSYNPLGHYPRKTRQRQGNQPACYGRAAFLFHYTTEKTPKTKAEMRTRSEGASDRQTHHFSCTYNTTQQYRYTS